MRETWYVLEDGTVVDPNEVAPDKSGVLRHKSGAAVKMRSPGVPSSRGVDPDEVRAKAKTATSSAKPAAAPASNREVKPEGQTGGGYSTR